MLSLWILIWGSPPYGDELLKMMKQKIPSVTVVMMSGEGAAVRTQLLSEGADAFFEKPLDFLRLGQFLRKR